MNNAEFGCGSIVEAVSRHAEKRPDALCLADAKMRLDYREAWDCITGFAVHLRELVPAGSFAVVECNQSVQYLVTMLALHYAGIIAVPLERRALDARKEEIASETKAALFIGEDPFVPSEGELVSVDIMQACDFAGKGDSSSFPMPRSEDMAEILFSTGTTGKSKGIMISHRNNMAIAENVVCGLQMPSENVEVIPMPTSHSHGLRRTYANLVNGSAAVFCDGVVAVKKMFNLMDEYHATSMDLSPSMLSIILKLTKDRLAEYADVLEYVQLGSAPLGEEDKLRLSELLPHTRLYNFYGSTEAGCSCLLDFGSMSGKKYCIGRPGVNSEFIIVDENRKPIKSSANSMGLIASSGGNVMMGYFHAEELTRQTMQDGIVYTSDEGYIDEDGLVYMLGRKDDVINFGGVKIAPEEVESQVMKCDMVKDCALIPVEDSLSGQIPKLFIVLADGREYDARELKTFLQGAVDANKQPQKIEVLEEIPRTFNGKIKRKELIGK